MMIVRKRLKIQGPALVFVTTTVTDWVPIFEFETVAFAALSQLRETLQHFQVSLVGYVLMPSHFHALLGFPEIEQLSRFMQSYKSLATRRIEQLDLGRLRSRLIKDDKFRLWKPRFDDLIVVSEEQFRIKLDYIHNNPVKAGLVNKPAAWPYSSAATWQGDATGILEIDKTYNWTKRG